MKRMFLIAAALLVACSPIVAADALTEALQKGLFEEEANHNLEAAIKAYQDVLSRADEQRRVAATALFRLAECYRKQGKTNEASVEYRRLVRDYADQTTLVNLSRQNLAGLGVSTPTGTAADPAMASTEVEEKEIRRIKAMIRDSPDLVNARSGGQGGSTELIGAARSGHSRVVEYLLANGADVEIRDLYNGKPHQTPLHAAASSGHKRVVELLLGKGAAVNAVDQFGRTPLHIAVRQGFRGVIDVLLAHKADVNAATESGHTPLHAAIDATHVEMAKFLIDRGANVNFAVEQRPVSTSFGGVPRPSAGNAGSEGTILHYAVTSLKPVFVELLLKSGADPNARTARGLTALHEIADGENVPATRREIAKLLIDHKAEVNAVGTGTDYGGWTPLDLATSRGLTGVAALLLEKEANPNVLVQLGSGEDLATTLHLAVDRGRHEIAELLLKRGANVDALNSSGNTALYSAASAGSTNLVALLLRHNADPNGAEGRSPLINPVHQNNTAIAEMLLAKGADPNVTNSYGTPLLHVALGSRPPGSPGLPIPAPPTANVGQPVSVHRSIPPVAPQPGQIPRRVETGKREEPRQKTMFELLLEHKADPNIRDHMANKESETTLHLATRNNNERAIELLLEAGADVNATTASGITPLHWTAHSGNLRVLDMLLSRKANVNAANEKGETPLHQSVSSGLTNLIAPLLQAGADINACTVEGLTPLHKFIGSRSINEPHEFAFVEFLLKSGADVVKKCGNRLSAFEQSIAGGNVELSDLLRKHHPKKLATARFEGQVRRLVWFWETEKQATLSQAIAAIGLTDKADPLRITLVRNDESTGLNRRATYNLLAIRERLPGHPDVPLQDGDKITVNAVE